MVGLCSGLFGVGGGFLMVPLQFFLLTSSGVDSNVSLLISFATSLAVIIPTSLSSVYRHNKELDNIIKPGLILGVFGLIGGLIGAFIAVRIPTRLLQIIFGFLLIFIAFKMFKDENIADASVKKNLNIYLSSIIGVAVGVFSGLLGVGGGMIIVPVLSTLIGYSFLESVGISSVFIILTAIGGISSYILAGFNINTIPYSIGYVNIINFIGMASFSIPFAYIGAKISHSISSNTLKKVFSVLVFIMAIKMMF